MSAKIELGAAARGAPGLRIRVKRPVDSWDRLAELVEYYAKGNWIFRGITDSSYKLIPKIGRKEARKDPITGEPRPYSLEDEIKMVDEFARQARPYFSQQPRNRLELLAVAQHHGLPTRLLDWTESLLVASYFAAEKAGTGLRESAIFAVRDLPVLKGDEDPFTGVGEVSIYRPPHISPRIPAQRAVFTVHPNPHLEPFEPEQVEELLLAKGRQTFWLKEILDACAINRAALFPDLDGLANYMGWRYKWGKLG